MGTLGFSGRFPKQAVRGGAFEFRHLVNLKLDALWLSITAGATVKPHSQRRSGRVLLDNCRDRQGLMYVISIIQTWSGEEGRSQCNYFDLVQRVQKISILA